MQAIERFKPAPMRLDWVDKLIQKLQARYGSDFARRFEGVPPEVLREEWAEELAGFTGEEVARGLQACRERPYAPTLPEFMVLCRPPINPEIAFHEAAYCTAQRRRGERGDWTHPAIYHAAIKIGQHDLVNCSYATLKSRWNKVLSDELARGQWEPIPDAAPALPEPRKTELSDAQAKKAMASLGAGAVLDKSGIDHKAWARGIVANPKGRPPAIVAMAQRALGGAGS